MVLEVHPWWHKIYLSYFYWSRINTFMQFISFGFPFHDINRSGFGRSYFERTRMTRRIASFNSGWVILFSMGVWWIIFSYSPLSYFHLLESHAWHIYQRRWLSFALLHCLLIRLPLTLNKIVIVRVKVNRINSYKYEFRFTLRTLN